MFARTRPDYAREPSRPNAPQRYGFSTIRASLDIFIFMISRNRTTKTVHSTSGCSAPRRNCLLSIAEGRDRPPPDNLM